MQIKRIGVAIATTESYDRAALHGIISYCRAHGTWKFLFNDNVTGPRHTLSRLAVGMKTMDLQGIIINLWVKDVLGEIMQWKRPVVEISGMAGVRTPSVHVDNDAVGTMAAQHFLERGLSHFGFVGWQSVEHCEQRRDAFIRTLAQEGYGCNVLMLPLLPRKHWSQNEVSLRLWIKSLPKPVGVFCWYDYPAQEAILACHQLGIAVPQEVAVLGVDNDEVNCTISETPISSIDVNPTQIGYEAAKLLHRLIDGKKPPAGPVLLPPRGLVVRQSSDTLANVRLEVAKALQFIHDHANEGIRVSDVLRQISISRRALEMELARLLRRSPLQQIRYERIQRAKSLLLDTDLSVLAIAKSCGFHSASSFGSVYKAATGSSPAQFRAKHRISTL